MSADTGPGEPIGAVGPVEPSAAAARPSGNRSERSQVLVDSLGVGVATGAYGLSFGAIAVASGFSVWQACALSLLVFSGASQFAVVSVVAAGGASMSAAATGLMLGSRNTLYGLKLASLLKLRGLRRILGAQLVIDESTAMALKPADRANARLGFFTTGIAVFVLWNLATLIGAVAGRAVGDPTTFGFDAAVPAAFLALLWPRLSTWRARATALAAAALAVTLVPLTRPGLPIIAAAGIAVLAALKRDGPAGPAGPAEQPAGLPAGDPA